jgi:hypothetical protein
MNATPEIVWVFIAVITVAHITLLYALHKARKRELEVCKIIDECFERQRQLVLALAEKAEKYDQIESERVKEGDDDNV